MTNIPCIHPIYRLPFLTNTDPGDEQDDDETS